jgi:hypothetical protein
MKDLVLTRVGLSKLVKNLLKRNKEVYLTSANKGDIEEINSSLTRDVTKDFSKKLTKKDKKELYETFKNKVTRLVRTKIKGNISFRKRRISKSGDCYVSYKSADYRGWSEFGESCFMEYRYENQQHKK